MMPAIIPMPLGEPPTEPGWYIASSCEEDEVGCVEVVEMEHELWVWVTWDDTAYAPDEFMFIARIYPDRIEGREG